MAPTLTIVGASVRAAAFSAQRAGYRVRAADMYGDVDLRRACAAFRVVRYPQGLAAAIRGPHDGGWMYCGALENYPRLIDRWARLRPLWGNPGRVVRRVRDPRAAEAALAEAGLRCPAIADDDGLSAIDGHWLRKPLRSAGGAHITRYDPQSPRDAPAGEFYLQQFIEGRPCSAVFVAAAGRAVLLGVTRQLIGTAWLGGSGFRYCGSVGPLDLAQRDRDTLQHIGDVLAARFELVGLFGVDAVVNGDGVWPIEVNPRYTASMELLERALDVRAVDLHVRACQDGELPSYSPRHPDRQYGKAIVFASQAVAIPPDWPARAEASSSRWPALADIPAGGSTIETGCANPDDLRRRRQRP